MVDTITATAGCTACPLFHAMLRAYAHEAADASQICTCCCCCQSLTSCRLPALPLQQVPASGHTPGAKPTDADSKKLADALTSGNSATVAQSLATSYEGKSRMVCLLPEV